MMSFCLVKMTQPAPACARLATVPRSQPWPDVSTSSVTLHFEGSRIPVYGTKAASIVLQSVRHPLLPVFRVPVSHQPPALLSATADPQPLCPAAPVSCV